MSTQRLHSALAPIDVLTREELSQELNHTFDEAMRTRYIGLELQRIPFYPIIAGASTVQLYTQNDATPWGPEQGDIWMLRRVIVKSNVLSDTAHYQLFRGSTPSDVNNSYTSRQLLEGFNPGSAAITQPTPSQPGVPATGVAQQNTNSYPVQVVISANGATITNVSVNGITVGTAAGTYDVPAYGAISIAYSVATPTWVWSNLTPNVAAVPAGQNVNIGYYPGTKAVFLQPGEQVYAQIQGATNGNQYVVEGEAIRCIAEMKGKIL